MSKQLRIRVIGLLVVLLSGFAAVGMIVPACGFSAPNQRYVPSDGADIPDSPPDAFVPDAAPCSSLIKTCVTGDLLRECQALMTLPKETACDWGCTEPVPGNGRCKTFTPSGGAVTPQDLDRPAAMVAGLQKRTFTSIASTGTIHTGDGTIRIGLDTRGEGTGVVDGVDFKVVNGVGIFRFMEVEFKGIQAIRVEGPNALAIVGIDRITVSDATLFDLRGTCMPRVAGPGGKIGGATNGNGSGNGAGGAGDNINGCSGGGGAGNSRNGASGGNRILGNGGGTTGNATISVLTGGAGGGGASNGEGGGGGGAIQLVSNGQVKFDAGTLSQVGINAGGCGGRGGTCGGGAGAGGAILIEGRTVDLSDAYFAVNGGGGGGGGGVAAGASGSPAQVFDRAAGGNGAIGAGSNDDGGDGGGGGDDGSLASSGGQRDQRGGGGGGGVGWIRIHTKSGAIGGSAFFSPSNPSQSASTGMANVQ